MVDDDDDDDIAQDVARWDRVAAVYAETIGESGDSFFRRLQPFLGDEVGDVRSHDVDKADDPRPWRRHVRGYLEHEERWITAFGGHTHYHRPLSWYVSRMAGAGLAVTGLAEPPSLPPHERAEWSEYERWFSEIPTMLAWSARQFPTPRPAMNAEG